MTKPKRKGRVVNGILLAAMVISVILFFTPFVYDSMQSHYRSEVATNYKKRAYPADSKRDVLIKQYNANIAAMQKNQARPFAPVSFKQIQSQVGQAFGYVTIPAIHLQSMPAFYGTSDRVLSKGVGALPYTSLPASGTNVTASLTAHTGLANRVFFDNIRYLKKGDVVYVDAFAHKYAYAVDGQKVIDPLDKDAPKEFFIKDSVNKIILMTCTPQGINDHRLLVYAHRIPYKEAQKKPVTHRDTFSLINLWKYLFIFLLIVFALLYWYLSRKHKRAREAEGND